MVKTISAVYHAGLRDWVVQRLTAIYMAIYSIALVLFLVIHPDLYFVEWRYIFAQDWMKILTILFILCVVLHAWVGVWTIITDYVNSTWIRIILNILVIFSLFAFFIWGILILWSV